MQAPPTPALLDVTSINPSNVLVLDSFFYVVVFHGSTVAAWRAAEYHLQAQHAAFATLLDVRPRRTACLNLQCTHWHACWFFFIFV